MLRHAPKKLTKRVVVRQRKRGRAAGTGGAEWNGRCGAGGPGRKRRGSAVEKNRRVGSGGSCRQWEYASPICPQAKSGARTSAGEAAGACCQQPGKPASTPVQGEKLRQATHTTGRGARPQGRQAHRKGRTSTGKDAEGNPHGHSANRAHGETGSTAGTKQVERVAQKTQGRQAGRWSIRPKPVLQRSKAM